jgi:hypothetical protein
MNKRTAEFVLSAALREGGGTFSQSGESIDITSGYAVGVFEETFRSPETYSDAVDGIIAVAEMFPDAYIGLWVDDKTAIHIDPVVVIQDYGDAVAYGRRTGQIGIYDFAKGQTILL